MRNISRWGKQNPGKARIIIVLSILGIAITGFLSGQMLAGSGNHLPSSGMLWIFIFSSITAISYPFKTRFAKKIKASEYAYRKSCDSFLVVAAFLVFMYLGNKPDLFFRYGTLRASCLSLAPVTDSLGKTYKTVWNFHKSMKAEDGKMLKWKERKKLMKEQIRGIKKARELSGAAKTLLIILSILVAIGLSIAVIALSCEIACSGSGVAAGFVLTIGMAAIGLLLILAIRAIIGKKKKRIKDPDTRT